MDLEDCRRLDNVEDGIHQDGCNPLKFHCTEISGDVRAAKKKSYSYYMFAITVVPAGMKKSR